MRSKILVMLTMATFVGCCVDECSAQLFRRRRAQVPSQACPGGVCRLPGYGGGGQLQVNANGGFTGQLPNTYYQQFTGQTAVKQAAPATAVVAQPLATKAVRATVAVAATPSDILTVEQANELLEAARSKLAAAEIDLERATSNAQRLAAIAAAEAEAEQQLAKIAAMKASAVQAAELYAEIRDLELDSTTTQRQLAALKQQHKAWQTKAGK